MQQSTRSERSLAPSTLAHGIRTPLAALRASIEALGAKLRDHAARRTLQRVLGELGRVERCAEALIELTSPTPLRPLRCSLRELAQSALTTLPPGRRSRVWVALEPPAEDATPGVVVDGPVLVRALSTFLDRATEDGAEVLLHAHKEDGVTTFAIVGDLTSEHSQPVHVGEDDREDDPPRPADLGIEIAERDVSRMGGRVQVHRATAEHRCVIVSIPDGAGGAAA